MDLLQSPLSQKTNQELASSRYGHDYMESVEDALRRAQGIAGLLIDSAIMAQNPQAGHEIHALHLEHTVKSLELEISDALILVNRMYAESKGE